jgi:hypothetical protein
MPFTISFVGDIIAVAFLSKDVATRLSKGRGSSAEYRTRLMNQYKRSPHSFQKLDCERLNFGSLAPPLAPPRLMRSLSKADRCRLT